MIHSGGPLEADIPDVDLTSFTLQRAGQLGDKPALIDGGSGRALSYSELDRSVRSYAAGLAARGFAKGDTFGIFMPNVPEYAVAFHGVLAAGGRCTTANPLYTARELGFQLADAGASMLLTVAPFLEVAREAAAHAGCEVFVLGEADGAASFSELLGDPAATPDIAIDPANDIAAIPYSSGTTGLPKGVMLSHSNLVANMIQSEAVLGVTSDDVVIAMLPFFHCYGLCVILNLGLRAGATLITHARFEFEQFLDLVERHRATRGYVVPPIALALAKHPAVEGRDLSSLRHVLCGAAPLGADLADACERRIGCPVTQGYGMTEMSPITHLVPPFGELNKPGSIGPPIPGTECRLVDPDTGEEVGAGERGELWMRGPHVMQGYLGNPEATAAMIDPDGWLHSGDVAVVDDDGWFTIVDRVKELIKYKAFQVAPAELEAILITHPEVADCAVVGIPDEEAGELPKAFVVAAGDELDLAAVSQFVADQVAPHKRLRAIEVIEEIPKSPSGKILRRVLRDRERETATL
jgi:acyl-CoA synthetase (AMP-forming)/AMP-acid ligase II